MTRSSSRFFLSWLAFAGIAAALGACADSSKLVYLPSGDAGFAINCSGSDASTGWGDCYRRAGEACGNYGYDVVSKDDDKGAVEGGSLLGIVGANTRSRSLVIKCRK